MAPRRKYDWEKWLVSPRTVLVRGIDYHCSQSSMIGQIRNSASRCGMRVRITDNNHSIIIEVIGEISHPNKVAFTG